MERGLLSDEKLQARYDDVVWMYLFQDFSGSEADRAAERVAVRFGITAWPQHFLVDPRTLEVLADTGRSLESFDAAVDRAAASDGPGPSTGDLREADALAASLETDASPARARELLQHDDVVVRFRATQRLVDTDPDSIVRAAATLLEHAHDQTRFLVCQTIAKHPGAADERTRSTLETLTRTPTGSKNPNVLRIRCVQALAEVGNADSVATIAPHAASGVYFNGLTGVSIDALRRLGTRVPQSVPAIVKALAGAFPSPPADADDARAVRSCTALARRVHDALVELSGTTRPFPERYDDDARRRLQQLWR